jgi:pancreatic triacylglycerol lipase
MIAFILLSLFATSSALPRWNLLEDHFGKIHMVDLKPIDAEVKTFDATNEVFFMLFTRTNPVVGQRIGSDRSSILSSSWNSAFDVRVLVHGFQGSHTAPENIVTTAEFLRRRDYNVIGEVYFQLSHVLRQFSKVLLNCLSAVDWSAIATTDDALARSPEVGAVIGRFIDFLHQQGFTHHSRVNIIGHSLGSHVAGFTGKSVMYGKINAIFATDPGAFVISDDPSGRLDESDAVYVESIITSSIGFRQPISHATFYPNWGLLMPGCGINMACNHHRATEFYTESISSNNFIARQCTDVSQINSQNCPGTGVTAIMGGDYAKSIRGVFFLETNAEAPFARG